MNKNNGTVFRVHKTKDYTVMANHHLRNKELSLKAKGLLSQMLSLPEGWEFSQSGLAAINQDGVASVRSGLEELEKHRYLKREEKRIKGKFSHVEYNVYEKPFEPICSFTISEKPITDSTISDNQDNKVLKELNTKELSTKDIKPYSPLEYFETFWKKYPNKKGKGNAVKSFEKKVKDEEIYKLIMKDLDNRKYDEQWIKEEGKYIPHPATYLNQERWLDEYEIKEQEDDYGAENRI